MRILLGITGGIAAYKAAGLLRALAELGHDVTALPTENALRFIGPATLEALSGKNIDPNLYGDVASVRHVELGQQSDLIVVAPATAAFLGRYASGIADDLLLNALLASTSPVVVVPAMHTEMWQNPATEENVATLRSRGVRVMEPATGRLTGEDSGPGRLPEVAEIVDFVFSQSKLSRRTVVVTAGGTQEPIDDVRFIGNRSSGQMGIELAAAARDLGARVKLIACNLSGRLPAGVEIEHVQTVEQLGHAIEKECDVLVMAAAVSDFRVAMPAKGKLSRADGLTLELVPTEDLLAGFTSKHPKTLTVGFALVDESRNLKEVSKAKLEAKGCDFMVGNTTATLDSPTTQALLLDSESAVELGGSKSEVARNIMQSVAAKLS